jgi:hypothetical protein
VPRAEDHDTISLRDFPPIKTKRIVGIFGAQGSSDISYDLIIMFHPGIFCYHSWKESVPYLKEAKAPVIITCWTETDMLLMGAVPPAPWVTGKCSLSEGSKGAGNNHLLD